MQKRYLTNITKKHLKKHLLGKRRITMKKLVTVLLAVVFAVTIIGCGATNLTIQNPIKKANTEEILDKMEKSYGAPKYRFQIMTINGEQARIEYYYYRVDENNVQVVKVINGIVDTGDNIETD
jgi:hypothetical protein